MNNENKIKYDSSVGKLLENIKVDYSKFMSNPEIFVSYDRLIIRSLYTMKIFQTHARNVQQFEIVLCHLITKIK